MFPPHSITRLRWCLLALALSTAISQAQLISVCGNGVEIFPGDRTPSPTNNTHFGNINVGPAGFVDHVFTIKNGNETPLRLLGTPLDGAHRLDFAIVAPFPQPFIAGNGEAELIVRFRPADRGTRSATLRIFSSSTTNSTYEFDLEGVGIRPAPNIEVQGGGLAVPDGFVFPLPDNNTDFESVNVGESKTHTFTILNTGEITLAVSRVNITGIHSDQYSVTKTPAQLIGAGLETTFEITYTPTRSGPHRAEVQISNNDPTPSEAIFNYTIAGFGRNNLPEFVLLGNGQVIEAGDQTPAPGDHTQFPGTDLNGSSRRTFTVQNSGSAPLTITDLDIVGGDLDQFSVSQPPASAIDPGSEATFEVTFRPTSNGLKATTLRISNNDAANPVFDVSLEGISGAFKLLSIERDGNDALITFNTNPTLGTYIYRIYHSTDMDNWTRVGSIFSDGGELLQFRHRDSLESESGYWRLEEIRFQ